MNTDSITTWAAIAAFIIIPAVILWPEFTKDTRRSKATYSKPTKAISKPAPKPKPEPKPARPTKPGINPETLKAMHKQADAERAIAEAIERKASKITDPVKRARLDRQAANSWLKFNQILDKIDKLTV